MNREQIIALITKARLKGNDKAYRAWIRTLGCCVCNPPEGMQFGVTEAAHVARSSERGIGCKAEFACVPLCKQCHFAQHQYGEQGMLTRRINFENGLTVPQAKAYFDSQRIKYLEMWLNV